MVAQLRQLSASLALGIAVALTASCADSSSSPPPAQPAPADKVSEYVSAARAVLPAKDNAVLTDEQIAANGAYICQQYAGPHEEPPIEVRQLHELTRRYCDALANVDQSKAAGAGVGAQLSERGAWPLEIGQTVEVPAPQQPTAVGQRFTIKSVRQMSDACPGLAEHTPGAKLTPKNGRILALDVAVENTANYVSDQRGSYPGGFVSREFVALDGTSTQGVSADLEVDRCLPPDQRAGINPEGPARKFAGTIYVDVPRAEGFLILGPAFGGNQYELHLTAG